jgi:hypothetical protein
MMGRGFEIQRSQQLPVWTIEQVDLRHMQSRVDERRSHRMPQVVKPGVRQPSSQGWTSAAFLDGAVPKDTVVSFMDFTYLHDSCQTLCARHRPYLTSFRRGRTQFPEP